MPVSFDIRFAWGARAVAALVFAAAAMVASPPVAAQQVTPQMREFRAEMEAELREHLEKAPRDALLDTAARTLDTYPVIFQAIADTAYSERRRNPSVVLDPNWMTRYFGQMVSAVVALHGKRISESPREQLEALNSAWLAYLDFLAEHDEASCAKEVSGTLISVRPAEFRSATGADEATMGRLGQLNSAVVIEMARAALAGTDAQLRDTVEEADIETLTRTLVSAGFTDQQASGIVDGNFGGGSGDAERCRNGIRFYRAIGEVPEATRREMLAFYLAPR